MNHGTIRNKTPGFGVNDLWLASLAAVLSNEACLHAMPSSDLMLNETKVGPSTFNRRIGAVPSGAGEFASCCWPWGGLRAAGSCRRRRGRA